MKTDRLPIQDVIDLLERDIEELDRHRRRLVDAVNLLRDRTGLPPHEMPWDRKGGRRCACLGHASGVGYACGRMSLVVARAFAMPTIEVAYDFHGEGESEIMGYNELNDISYFKKDKHNWRREGDILFVTMTTTEWRERRRRLQRKADRLKAVAETAGIVNKG